jgi:hypothetical protein
MPAPTTAAEATLVTYRQLLNNPPPQTLRRQQQSNSATMSTCLSSLPSTLRLMEGGNNHQVRTHARRQRFVHCWQHAHHPLHAPRAHHVCRQGASQRPTSGLSSTAITRGNTFTSSSSASARGATTRGPYH